MAFLPPSLAIVDGLPVIWYAETDVILDGSQPASEPTVAKLLAALLETCPSALSRVTDYFIAFIWMNAGNVLIDLWRFWDLSSWGSGPLGEVTVFRDLVVATEMGLASGNTLIVLGREEELRRSCKSLDEYLCGSRPSLPNYLIDEGSDG